MWVRISVMTVPKVQSSSVPWLVEVMRLTGMASMMGHSAALKMSWSFFLSLTRLCCRVRKMCGVNRAIHAGSGMTKLLRSSLFMVFMTTSSFFAIKGLFSCSQQVMKFSHEHVGATHGHNPAVVSKEINIHIRQYSMNDVVNVPVSSCVIASKVAHDQAGVHVIME